MRKRLARKLVRRGRYPRQETKLRAWARLGIIATCLGEGLRADGTWVSL